MTFYGYEHSVFYPCDSFFIINILFYPQSAFYPWSADCSLRFTLTTHKHCSCLVRQNTHMPHMANQSRLTLMNVTKRCMSRNSVTLSFLLPSSHLILYAQKIFLSICSFDFTVRKKPICSAVGLDRSKIICIRSAVGICHSKKICICSAIQPICLEWLV